MKVLFVARDVAPSDALQRAANVLKDKGEYVITCLGHGKPGQDISAATALVGQADRVVIGMSSSPELAEIEIAAASAAKNLGVTYGFYLDTANCHEREWFGTLRDNASFFLVINEKECIKVANRFPNARIYVTGNPSREDAFFPRFTREKVREKLGVSERETLVLAPGGKSPVVNIAIWSTLLDALEEAQPIPGDTSFQVIFAPHPGDRTPFAVDFGEFRKLTGEGRATSDNPALALMNIYGDLMKFSPVPAKFVSKDILSTVDMIPGADIIVEFGSTIALNAAALRKPVLTVSTALARKRLFSTSKTETTEPVELGISQEVLATKLSDTLTKTLNEWAAAAPKTSLEIQQELECPEPNRQGEAVEQMVKAVIQG